VHAAFYAETGPLGLRNMHQRCVGLRDLRRVGAAELDSLGQPRVGVTVPEVHVWVEHAHELCFLLISNHSCLVLR
jgi:hypothetical protein